MVDNRIKITQAEFIEKMKNLKGSTFATITTFTTPSNLRKTDNPFYDKDTKFMDVVKAVTYQVIINFNYENSVNNQRGRENNTLKQPFEAKERSWGTRVPGTNCLIQHNNKFYLETKLQKAFDEALWLRKSTAEIIDPSEITPFVPEKRSNAEHQGVDNEIIIMSPALESIREIKVGGHHYLIQG